MIVGKDKPYESKPKAMRELIDEYDKRDEKSGN